MMVGTSMLAFFVTPWLIGLGAALASIPIIIHLLSRRKVRRLRWPAMQWLLAAMKRHQRRLKLENWLILLLRVAALLLLGFALARPIITNPDVAGLLGGKRTVFLVIDTSYSTDAKTDARSVFERIKREADLVLASLGNEDAISVLTTNDPRVDVSSGTQPYVLVPRNIGGEGVARAKEAIATLRPRQAPASWVETLAALKRQMAPEDVNRQVVVLTDLQARDWVVEDRDRIPDPEGAGADSQPAGAVAPGETGARLTDQLVGLLRGQAQVHLIDVGGDRRDNLAILGIRDETERGVFVGHPMRLEVEVANFGSRAVSGAVLEVQLDAQASVQRELLPDLPAANMGLRVPEPARARVSVDISRTAFAEAGSHYIRMRITPPSSLAAADGLALDSERFFAVNVRRRISVVSWTNASPNVRGDAKRYLDALYTPVDAETRGSLYEHAGFAREDELLDRLRRRDREPIDLVVLANAVPRDPRLLAALRTFVSQGGGLLYFAGDNVSMPLAFNDAFHPVEVEERLCPYPMEKAATRDESLGELPFHLDLRARSQAHPVAQPIVGPGAEEWIRLVPPKTWSRVTFATRPPASPEPGTPGGETETPAGEVVLRYRPEPGKEEGPAAVVATTFGRGRTLWVGTTLDDGWRDAEAVALFLPVFLEEATLWLTAPAERGRALEIGGRISTRLPLGAERPRFSIPMGGQRGPTRRTEESPDAGPATVEFDDVGAVGIWTLSYRLQDDTGEATTWQEHFAVNPNPAEGLLARAEDANVRAGIPSELGLQIRDTFGGEELETGNAQQGEITRILLYILLALMVLETWLAMRFGRRSMASDEQGATAQGGHVEST